jgi:hypothetical protein
VSVIWSHLLVRLVDDAGGDHPGQDADDGLLGLFGKRPPPFGWRNRKPRNIQSQLSGRG